LLAIISALILTIKWSAFGEEEKNYYLTAIIVEESLFDQNKIDDLIPNLKTKINSS